MYRRKLIHRGEAALRKHLRTDTAVKPQQTQVKENLYQFKYRSFGLPVAVKIRKVVGQRPLAEKRGRRRGCEMGIEDIMQKRKTARLNFPNTKRTKTAI